MSRVPRPGVPMGPPWTAARGGGLSRGPPLRRSVSLIRAHKKRGLEGSESPRQAAAGAPEEALGTLVGEKHGVAAEASALRDTPGARADASSSSLPPPSSRKGDSQRGLRSGTSSNHTDESSGEERFPPESEPLPLKSRKKAAPADPETSTDVASTDVASTDVASTDVASTDVASTDVASTDVASTDVASTDVASSDVASTDAASSDVASTDVASTDVTSTDVASSDVASTDAASSDVASTDVASSDVASSDSATAQSESRRKTPPSVKQHQQAEELSRQSAEEEEGCREEAFLQSGRTEAEGPAPLLGAAAQDVDPIAVQEAASLEADAASAGVSIAALHAVLPLSRLTLATSFTPKTHSHKDGCSSDKRSLLSLCLPGQSEFLQGQALLSPPVSCAVADLREARRKRIKDRAKFFSWKEKIAEVQRRRIGVSLAMLADPNDRFKPLDLEGEAREASEKERSRLLQLQQRLRKQRRWWIPTRTIKQRMAARAAARRQARRLARQQATAARRREEKRRQEAQQHQLESGGQEDATQAKATTAAAEELATISAAALSQEQKETIIRNRLRHQRKILGLPPALASDNSLSGSQAEAAENFFVKESVRIADAIQEISEEMERASIEVYAELKAIEDDPSLSFDEKNHVALEPRRRLRAIQEPFMKRQLPLLYRSHLLMADPSRLCLHTAVPLRWSSRSSFRANVGPHCELPTSRAYPNSGVFAPSLSSSPSLSFALRVFLALPPSPVSSLVHLPSVQFPRVSMLHPSACACMRPPQVSQAPQPTPTGTPCCLLMLKKALRLLPPS
ncbi:ribosomal protein [Cyclospora cayetanensis]|uniref:Ribosomal protein n=1 Tax=Cyclospora cayetanensis TaxID=88456 RepID=A0A1D3CU04_9EIME|nr:ribosomal protein [Cyclospora cayetanensis]